MELAGIERERRRIYLLCHSCGRDKVWRAPKMSEWECEEVKEGSSDDGVAVMDEYEC